MWSEKKCGDSTVPNIIHHFQRWKGRAASSSDEIFHTSQESNLPFWLNYSEAERFQMSTLVIQLMFNWLSYSVNINLGTERSELDLGMIYLCWPAYHLEVCLSMPRNKFSSIWTKSTVTYANLKQSNSSWFENHEQELGEKIRILNNLQEKSQVLYMLFRQCLDIYILICLAVFLFVLFCFVFFGFVLFSESLTYILVTLECFWRMLSKLLALCNCTCLALPQPPLSCLSRHFSFVSRLSENKHSNSVFLGNISLLCISKTAISWSCFCH